MQNRELLIIIDEQKIFDVITERKPISVAINGPDGMLPKIQETAQHIMEKFDIPAFVLGDTCLLYTSPSPRD